MTRKISDPIEAQPTRIVGRHLPKRILVANAKGGCGKTTLVTNIAAYLAVNKNTVAIIDHDPQGSSTQWLSVRNEKLPQVLSGFLCVMKSYLKFIRWRLFVVAMFTPPVVFN